MTMISSQQRAELVALHEQAGVRYAAAVHEVEAAYVELLGVGIAASNNLAGAIPETDRLVPTPQLSTPIHPRFLPAAMNHYTANTKAIDRANALLASVGINN